MPIQKTSSIFNLAKELTYDIKLTLIFTLVVEIINQGQVLSIILKAGDTFSDDDASNWFEPIRTVLLAPSFFGTFNVFTSGGLIEAIWIIFTLYLIWHCIAISLVAVYSALQRPKQWLSRLMTMVSLIHSRVLFLPIHYFFLQILQYLQNSTTPLDTFIDGTPFFVVTIMLLIINFLIACLKEFICYRIDKDRSAYCSKTSLQFKLALMYKGIAAIILLPGTDTTVTSQVVNIMGIIYGTTVIYILYSKIPFYNLIVMKFSYILVAITLPFGVFSILSNIEYTKSVACSVLVAGIPFSVLFTWNKLRNEFERILRTNFGTAERAIHFPILLKRYTSRYDTLISVRKRFPLESLYFYNFFISNIYESEEIKGTRVHDLMNQDFYISLISKCSTSRINYKKSDVFLLYIAKILITKLGNTFQALTFMEEAKAANPSIHVRLSIENLYNSLKLAFSKQMDPSASTLDLGSYFKHRDELNLLKKDMRIELKYHQDFWTELSQDRIDVKTILDLSDKIEKIHLGITKRWAKKAIDFQKSYSGALIMYSFYLDLIRGMPHDSIPLIRKYYTLARGNMGKNKEDTVSDSTVIMIASIEKEKLGVVTDVSDSVYGMFGISRERLVGSKVNILMPNFIGSRHDKFLQRYTQNSSSPESARKITSFGKAIDGTLIELDLEFKIYPYLDKGVNMMAYIKQLSVPEQLMIIKPDGRIAECSLNIQKVLKLNGSSLDTVNIREICPEFTKVNFAFNIHYGNNELGIQEDIAPTQYDPRDMLASRKTNFDQLNSVMDGTVKTKEEDGLLNTQLFSPTSPLMSPQLMSPQQANTPLLIKNRTKISDMITLTKNTSSDISIKPTLNEQEAREVCEKYKEGNPAKFFPYSTSMGAKRAGVSFNISVEPYILEKKVYKVIRLLDIEGINDETKNIDDGSALIKPKQSLLKSLKSDLNTQKSALFGNMSQTIEGSDSESSDPYIPDEKNPYAKPEFAKNPPEFKKTDALQMQRSEQNIIGNIREDIMMKMLLNELGSALESQKIKRDEFELDEAKDRVQHMMIKHSIQGSSATSASNMNLKLIKRLNDMFNIRKSRPVTLWSTRIVYLILLAILIFAFINMSTTQASLDRIKDGVDVIDIAGKRLNKALIAWEWMLMFYSRLLGLRDFFSVYGYSRKYIFNVTTAMNEYSKGLRVMLENIDNKDILDEFLAKNIKFYDATATEVYKGNYFDTFEASDQITLQNRFIGSWTDTDAKLVVRPEFITSINNTANDYLVVSESIMKRVYNSLQLIVSNNIEQSKEILVFEHIGLIFLCFSLLIVARVIIKAYSRIFQAITRINPESLKARQLQMKNFENMLDQDMEVQTELKRSNFSLLGGIDGKSRKKLDDVKKKKSGPLIKSYRMNGLTLHLGKYILISVVLILIISVMFLILYFQSLSSFDSLGEASGQIYTIYTLNYQGVVVLANFYLCIIFQNSTQMLLRNEAPMVQLDKNLQRFGQLNEQLLASFSHDASGLQDPVINAVLKGKICNYLSLDLQANCDTATDGGSLALLGINSKSYNLATLYINLYKANQTIANAKQLLKPYYDVGVALDRITDAGYSFLISYTLGKFYAEEESLKDSNLMLSWGVAVVIVVTAIAMHQLSIKRFIELEIGQRKIFKALTYYAFSQNKSLGFLLKRDYRNEVQGLGRILSV